MAVLEVRPRDSGTGRLALHFTCPGCGRGCQVPATMAGRRGRCPRCRAEVRVPGGGSRPRRERSASSPAPTPSSSHEPASATAAAGPTPSPTSACSRCGAASPSDPCVVCAAVGRFEALTQPSPPAGPALGQQLRELAARPRVRLAALGGVLAVALLAGGWHLYRQTHAYAVAVLTDPGSSYREKAVARARLLEATPAELSAALDRLEDPAHCPGFPELAAASRDPRHAAGVLRYVLQTQPLLHARHVRTASQHLQALRAFPPQVVCDLLFPHYADPRPAEVRELVAPVLADLPPEVLAPHVARLPGAVERGRFPEALALSGDPHQVEAIAAAAADLGDGPRFWARAVPAMVRLDRERAREALVAAWGERGPAPLAEALLERFSPRELVPGILALPDPAARGAFPEVLAASGDPAQVPAIAAAAATRASDAAFWKRATGAMLELDRAAARDALIHLWTQADLPPAREALSGSFAPRELLPVVLALEPAARGAFPELLAASGDPAQAAAILACAQRPRRALPRAVQLEALLTLGPPTVPALVESLTRPGPARALAVAALGRLDPTALARGVYDLLEAYAGRIRASAADPDPLARELRARQRDPLADSRRELDPAGLLGQVAEVEGELIDFCFLRALSSVDPVVAKRAADGLERRLEPGPLVDALFRFVAFKDRFSMDEVTVYSGLLARGTTERVVANLERLLDEAGGRPEDVYFLYKVLAFDFLREGGTAQALPVLERYAADTSAYVLEESQRDAFGRRVSRSEREIAFADAAAEAVRAIRGSPSRRVRR